MGPWFSEKDSPQKQFFKKWCYVIILCLVPILIFFLVHQELFRLLMALTSHGHDLSNTNPFIDSFGIFEMNIKILEGVLSITFSKALYLAIILEILTLSLIVIFFQWSEKMKPHEFGLKWSLSHRGLFQALLTATLAAMYSICLFIVSINALDFFDILKSMIPTKAETFDLSGLIIPISEEYIYRGVLCTLLVKYGLRWCYVIPLTSLFFIWHHCIYEAQSYDVVVYIFLTGCILGWVFYKTRTLIIPIILHILVNFITEWLRTDLDLLHSVLSFLIIN